MRLAAILGLSLLHGCSTASGVSTGEGVSTRSVSVVSPVQDDPNALPSPPRSVTNATWDQQVNIAQCCSFMTASSAQIVRPEGVLIDGYDMLSVEGSDYLFRVNFEQGPIGWEPDASGRRLELGGVVGLLAPSTDSSNSTYPMNEILLIPLREGERLATLVVRIGCQDASCPARERLIETFSMRGNWSANSQVTPELRSE